MATECIRQIEAFQPGANNWEKYTERIEQFFVANNVDTKERKRALFLTVISARTYSLLSNLIAPAKPSTKSYAELVKAMKDHLKPEPLVTVERFNFHRRT